MAGRRHRPGLPNGGPVGHTVAVATRELFRSLLGLAEILGVQVRLEPLGRRALRDGGLCSVRGRRVILLDASAPPVDRVAALADALSRLDLSTITLDPSLLLALADARSRRRWEDDQRAGRRRRRAQPNVRRLSPSAPGVRSARPRRPT